MIRGDIGLVELITKETELAEVATQTDPIEVTTTKPTGLLAVRFVLRDYIPQRISPLKTIVPDFLLIVIDMTPEQAFAYDGTNIGVIFSSFMAIDSEVDRMQGRVMELGIQVRVPLILAQVERQAEHENMSL